MEKIVRTGETLCDTRNMIPLTRNQEKKGIDYRPER